MWRLFQPFHQDMAIQMIVFSFHGDLQPLQGSCKHPQNGNGFSCKPGCYQWLRLTHDRWKDDSPSTPGRKTADVLDDISSLQSWEVRALRQRDADHMLKFALEMCRIQGKAGRLWCHEHPHRASSWKMDIASCSCLWWILLCNVMFKSLII